MSKPAFSTYDTVTAEILSRYSVTDLVQQTTAALSRGDDMFYHSDGDLEIIEKGETNHIGWWLIRSGEKCYEARRFKNFVWCSCRDFYFKRTMCKHLAMTVAVYCIRCRSLGVSVGKLCYACDLTVRGELK